jgi:uncharacterized membrane protein
MLDDAHTKRRVMLASPDFWKSTCMYGVTEAHITIALEKEKGYAGQTRPGPSWLYGATW